MGTEERAACKWQLRRGLKGGRGLGEGLEREYVSCAIPEDPCEDFRLGGASFVGKRLTVFVLTFTCRS